MSCQQIFGNPHFIPGIKFNDQEDTEKSPSVRWPETSALPSTFRPSAHCSVPCPQEEDVGSSRTGSQDLASDWHRVFLNVQVTRTVLKYRKQTSRSESYALSKKTGELQMYVKNTYVKVKGQRSFVNGQRYHLLNYQISWVNPWNISIGQWKSMKEMDGRRENTRTE